MKSMTGYGRGDVTREGCKVAVEITAVNRRQNESVLRLPPELEPLEPRIREELNRRVARGRLNLRCTLHRSATQLASAVHLNLPLAKACARQLLGLQKDLKLDSPLTLEALLRIPGVVETHADEADTETFAPAVEAAVDKALKALDKMREREGAHLAQDVRSRIATMRQLAREIAAQAPCVIQRYRQHLLDRIAQAGVPLTPEDNDRLLKEIVLFADRSDISEELTRLESHFQQFDHCVKSSEPVGRTLDFLAQEMNREINTIGSKANDSLISQAVVRLKAELEKFREQVQNIE